MFRNYMKSIFILTSTIIIIFIFSACANKEIELKQLNGEMIMASNDLTILNPSTGESKVLQESVHYSGAEFNETKDKILLSLSYFGATHRGDIAIAEYNIKDRTIATILTYKKNKEEQNWNWDTYDNARYIPNSSFISYKNGEDLFVFDLISKEEKFLIKMDGTYSWATDGNSLIYSNDDKIYNYDVKTNKSEFMFNGIDPEYSNDNKLIAYTKGRENSSLYVKEISAGKTLKCSSKRIGIYRFSPDDKYMAFTKNFSSIVGNANWDIRVWDFNENSVKTIVESDVGLWFNDWK